ncbi:MAG TPA: hypothetical protein VGR44_01930 [Methylomirabilota bacterium]|jgi:hypothetical protein|nr:hypothetical protein [Methylomirabilota bacterium]
MHRKKARWSFVAAAVAATLLLSGAADALEVGKKAPDFTLGVPGGKQLKLSEMLGKGPVVVFTFIQAFTAT